MVALNVDLDHCGGKMGEVKGAERLAEKLHEAGMELSADSLEWLFSVESCRPFLEAIVDSISFGANFISKDEMDRYGELRKAGLELHGGALENAVSVLACAAETIGEDLDHYDVESLQEQVDFAENALETLSTHKSILVASGHKRRHNRPINNDGRSVFPGGWSRDNQSVKQLRNVTTEYVRTVDRAVHHVASKHHIDNKSIDQYIQIERELFQKALPGFGLAIHPEILEASAEDQMELTRIAMALTNSENERALETVRHERAMSMYRALQGSH